MDSLLLFLSTKSSSLRSINDCVSLIMIFCMRYANCSMKFFEWLQIARCRLTRCEFSDSTVHRLCRLRVLYLFRIAKSRLKSILCQERQ
jgi:hypothetical protein